MNNRLTKISVLLGLTSILFLFTHCISEESSKKSSSGNSSRAPSSDPSTSNSNVATGIAAVEVSTGLKNHEQILYTMSALTDVPANNSTIMNTYNLVAVSLPTTNDVKSLLPPNQVAVVKLAAEFCNQFIESGSSRDATFTRVDSQNRTFRVNMSTVTLTTLMTTVAGREFQDRDIIIMGLVDKFWGGMISASDLAGSEAELYELMRRLADEDLQPSTLGDNEAATNAGAKKVVKGVCAATLSSAHVILF